MVSFKDIQQEYINCERNASWREHYQVEFQNFNI
jgi:hypothetical protein